MGDMSRYSGRSSGGGDRGGGAKVYVGNLGNEASKTELERTFGSYGHLRSVWIARNPPGFAFVEFEDPRDASDAVKDLDSSTICGQRARVELSSGESRRRSFGGRGGGGGGGGGRFGGGRGPPRGDGRCYECGEPGHFARECRKRGSGGGGGRGRRSYSRSRSRTPPPRRGRSHSRSRSRSR